MAVVILASTTQSGNDRAWCQIQDKYMELRFLLSSEHCVLSDMTTRLMHCTLRTHEHEAVGAKLPDWSSAVRPSCISVRAFLSEIHTLKQPEGKEWHSEESYTPRRVADKSSSAIDLKSQTWTMSDADNLQASASTDRQLRELAGGAVNKVWWRITTTTTIIIIIMLGKYHI